MDSDWPEIRQRLRDFASAREWGQFHSPKNLACALSVEAAELLEQFQWMPEELSRNLDPTKLQAVESEMADVFSYLLHLADQLGVDLLAATARKLDLNEVRYPVEKAKGRSDKYSGL